MPFPENIERNKRIYKKYYEEGRQKNSKVSFYTIAEEEGLSYHRVRFIYMRELKRLEAKKGHNAPQK